MRLDSYFPKVCRNDGSVSWRLTVHQALYFVLLFLLAGSQSVSNFMMSGMEILLAANWLLEWDMRRKFSKSSHRWLLAAFLTLLAVHLLWMIPSDNLDYGWFDLFKKLPLLAIPLVVLTARPLTKKQLQALMLMLVATVFVATIIGRVRCVVYPDMPYREITFISHIRFSLNVCLAIIFIVWFIVGRYKRLAAKGMADTGVFYPAVLLKDWLFWLMLVLLVSFFEFLLLVKSYTAFVALFIVAVVLLAFYSKRIMSRGLRTVLSLTMLALVVAVAAVTATMVRDYYTPIELASKPLAATTVNGNPYTHQRDGLMENGNYVNDYVCEVELEREWDKRSAMGLHSKTANAYEVLPTLVRYLNALGTSKDSVGMQLLSDEDVRAIEMGIANPVYLHGSKLRQMYYVMLFEYESSRCLGAVKDFTMLQRFELWRNAWRVFRQHPLFGVGTGDVVDACHAQLAEDDSPLAGTYKHTHNQYLTFLVSFGIVGFLLIALAFVMALRKERLLRLPAMAAMITLILVSFITEDTLETLAGCVFSVLFLCLLSLYNDQSPQKTS